MLPKAVGNVQFLLPRLWLQHVIGSPNPTSGSSACTNILQNFLHWFTQGLKKIHVSNIYQIPTLCKALCQFRVITYKVTGDIVQIATWKQRMAINGFIWFQLRLQAWSQKKKVGWETWLLHLLGCVTLSKFLTSLFLVKEKVAWITLRSSFQDLKTLKLANQEKLFFFFFFKSHSVGSMKKIEM